MMVTANTGMFTEVDSGPPTRMSSATAGSDVVIYNSSIVTGYTPLQSGGDNGISKGSTPGGKGQFGDINIGLFVSAKERHGNVGNDQMKLSRWPIHHRVGFYSERGERHVPLWIIDSVESSSLNDVASATI